MLKQYFFILNSYNGPFVEFKRVHETIMSKKWRDTCTKHKYQQFSCTSISFKFKIPFLIKNKKVKISLFLAINLYLSIDTPL